MKLNIETKEATGTIDELVKHYVRRAGWFDDLHSNMKARIKELEDDQDIRTVYSSVIVAEELKDQLKGINAWWEAKTVWEADYDGKSEVDMQLRHVHNKKLSGKGY
jgi:hypothetical protein